jgi:hypothetical protein
MPPLQGQEKNFGFLQNRKVLCTLLKLWIAFVWCNVFNNSYPSNKIESVWVSNSEFFTTTLHHSIMKYHGVSTQVDSVRYLPAYRPTPPSATDNDISMAYRSKFTIILTLWSPAQQFPVMIMLCIKSREQKRFP